MPHKSPIKAPSFPQLVELLQKTIDAARTDINHRLVIMYWTIGQAMASYLNGHPDQTSAALCRKLSPGINVHERTLQQCLQFFNFYPELDHDLAINWSQYRCLLALPSDKERRYWEKRIVKEGLNQKQLLGLFREKYHQPLLTNPAPLLPVPKRGLLYHYHLVSSSRLGEKKSRIMIDCGFQNRIEPPPASWKLVNKRVVRSEKIDGAYRVMATNETTDKIYTFAASVERVVDGDTLLADVDCGFGIWSRQRLRFKGINAFKLNTVKGQQSKKFVKKELAGLKAIVIRTVKDPEKYGRYLADIFYLKNCSDPRRIAAEGNYLNQILLDKRLARIYSG
ncbi:MAG: DUF1016 N-terminal domain-containing protein [Candidatus Omnitrophota bacterium]